MDFGSEANTCFIAFSFRRPPESETRASPPVIGYADVLGRVCAECLARVSLHRLGRDLIASRRPALASREAQLVAPVDPAGKLPFEPHALGAFRQLRERAGEPQIRVRM